MKNPWECWDSNPGLLGEKRERYLCAMPPHLIHSHPSVTKKFQDTLPEDKRGPLHGLPISLKVSYFAFWCQHRIMRLALFDKKECSQVASDRKFNKSKDKVVHRWRNTVTHLGWNPDISSKYARPIFNRSTSTSKGWKRQSAFQATWESLLSPTLELSWSSSNLEQSHFAGQTCRKLIALTSALTQFLGSPWTPETWPEVQVGPVEERLPSLRLEAPSWDSVNLSFFLLGLSVLLDSQWVS